MARLTLLQAGATTVYELSGAETTIGRHPECGVHIDSNMVSRRHAKVVKRDDGYYVEDLGSGNGTAINGQRIEAPTLLKHEDRIKLGPVLLRFESQAARGASPALKPVERTPARPLGGTDEMLPFDLHMAAGAEDSSTIMGSIGRSGGRYGSLDVQPEAKLNAVLEISRALAGAVEIDTILPRILDSLFSIFPGADRGCILLKDLRTGQMIPRAIKHRKADDDDSVKLSRTVLNKVLTEKTGILSADAATDSRFSASESISNFTIRSMMCVPLLGLDGEPLGVINIDTQNPVKSFKQEDLDLLMTVAGQAALCYETTRLVQSFVEKQKQDSEMRIATNVQRALLPERMPERNGYEFFATYEAAQAVGGDYYDCIQLPDDKVCVAFGDVAGKGVPASLVMSRLSSVVQSTLEFVQDIGTAIDRINHHMCSNAVEGRFVTFVLAVIDTRTHTMTLSIAGHMSPMIRKADGTIREFPEEIVGVPLCVIDGFPYEVATCQLDPGDTMVIYTDGVSEAMNPQSELYGVDRLREFIRQGAPQAQRLGEAILKDVRRHADGREQNDDITLMVVGRQR